MCIIKTGDNGTNIHLQSESDELQDISNLEVCDPGKFGIKLYPEPQYLPRITNLNGLVYEERRIFLFIFVFDYEFSIIDHHNNLIIDQLSTLADDQPITALYLSSPFQTCAMGQPYNIPLTTRLKSQPSKYLCGLMVEGSSI